MMNLRGRSVARGMVFILPLVLQSIGSEILRAESALAAKEGYTTVRSDAAEYTKRAQAHQVPAVRLVDQFGRPTDLRKLMSEDRPLMVNFIFTSCPTICPVLTSSFASVQKALDASGEVKPRMISISIDPAFDTPDRLLDYSRRYGAEDDWYFLTGHREDILQVLQAFDAYRGEKMNHTPVMFLRGRPGQSWVRLTGYPSVAELISEYHASIRP